MKRAILLLVVVVGGAFYLGWFTFTTDTTGNTEHVNIAIDKNKVHEDEARAIEKLHTIENQVQEQHTPSTSALPTDDKAADAQSPSPSVPRLAAAAGETSRRAPMTAQAGNNPYDAPAEYRQSRRPVAESGADDFSRGFQ